MIALLCFVLAVLAAPFKSKSRLEAENAALRHQLIVLRRKRGHILAGSTSNPEAKYLSRPEVRVPMKLACLDSLSDRCEL
jgi:hypothetical protein